ncbi:efflux RND transporter periplasmic adaptor subunit [Puniceicoccaceae bacterium K14]|nr:efflux RND transporter periplasmic adaptor subunit [Puniceicoccaceae bacterium K14]
MKSFTRNVLGPFIVLAVCVLGFVILTLAKEEVEKVSEVNDIMTLDVGRVKKVPYRETVRFTGRVRPFSERYIMPEVRGKVIYIHPNLYLGGRIQEGEELLRIEEIEYQLNLQQEEAQLRIEENQLKLEQGKARVASESVETYRNINNEEKADFSLALREPQIMQQEAVVSLHKSRVEKARLDLERCRIIADVDCLVLSKSLDIGQFVEVGETLAHLVESDVYEVVARVPFSQIEALRSEGENSDLSIQAMIDNYDVSGLLQSYLVDVDSETNRPGVLLRFDFSETETRPLLGGLVSGELMASSTRELVAVPEDVIVDDKGVWVVDEGEIAAFRHVEVAGFREGIAYLNSGLIEGERFAFSLRGILPEGQVVKVSNERDWR